MTINSFLDLGLAEPLLRALANENYTRPTPIQARSIPALLEGRDMLGIAQTGTGKTAAFSLPILDRLHRQGAGPVPNRPRALILAPTRELAAQIGLALQTYGRHVKVFSTTIFGGVPQKPQMRALQRGVHIVVATPGRLLDLMAQGLVRLDGIETLVLDEADRMLDMGFIPDIRRIVGKIPAVRHAMLFSATMPKEVASLAQDLLRDPLRVEVTPETPTVDRVDQRVYYVPKADKRQLLHDLLADPSMSRVIVFTRTKHAANRIATQLDRARVDTEALHGNKSQSQRRRALDRFRKGNARVLVATDIAARGIDVNGVSHVVNFDMPDVPETYVHRIGRTARAGAEGVALSFCDAGEQALLKDIERTIRCTLDIAGGEPWAERAPARRGGGQRRKRRSRGPDRAGLRAG